MIVCDAQFISATTNIKFVGREEWLCRLLLCTDQQDAADVESSWNMQSQLPGQFVWSNSGAKRKHGLFEMARANCLVLLDINTLTIKCQPRRTCTIGRSGGCFLQIISKRWQKDMALFWLCFPLNNWVSGQRALLNLFSHCRKKTELLFF